MTHNPKPHRLTPCHRHPDLPTTTGLCTPCLHQRLSLLTPSTSSSAIVLPPELRRCKTLSAAKYAAVVEPRRRSCDVGGRNSLSSLFQLDNDNNGVVESRNLGITCPVVRITEDEEEDVDDEIARVSNLGNNRIVESSNLGIICPVVEIREEDDDSDDDDVNARVSNYRGNEADFGDNRNVDARNLGITCSVSEIREEKEDDKGTNKDEIVRVSNFRKNESELDFELGKSMKEFIDLESEAKCKPNGSNSTNNRKEFRRFAGSFLGAASIFSKKLRKWRKKQESSARDRNCNDKGVGVSLGGRRLSYTQSEVGDYGFGRRSCDKDIRGSIELGRASIDCGVFGRNSCDSDPRFSIDLGRASVDCERMSVDEGKSGFVEAPRMSLDGYLGGGGGRTLARRGGGPVVSVIENAMATVYRFDDRVFVDGKVKLENEDDNDSLIRRRKGFDRCSSVKRDIMVTAEDGEAKTLSSAKASPAIMMNADKGLNEWRLSSRKDDSSESFETASKDLGSVSSSSIGTTEKKCRQWSKLWSFWGSLHRRKGGKGGKLQDEPAIADAASHDDITRTGASFSRRSTSFIGSGSGTTSRTNSKRRGNDGVLERNSSARYSPNHNDNDGLLRFYLTPLRRNRLGKSRLKKSHSLARSVLM